MSRFVLNAALVLAGLNLALLLSVRHAHWCPEGPVGARRRMLVYTPPGYARESKYPVLYLLHGSGDNDSHWMHICRANVIADNRIAEGKTVPMLIVMPDGHVRQRPAGFQPNEAIGALGQMTPRFGEASEEAARIVAYGHLEPEGHGAPASDPRPSTKRSQTSSQ